MSTIKISAGINFHLIKSKKFKTTTVCILIRRQLTKDEVTINAVIPNILKKASTKYPSLSKISAEIENLYGAIFDALIIKKGEEQILQFFVELVKRDNLVEKGLEFLKEIILNPLIIDGGFDREIVENEKSNLEKTIKGRVNNKSEYSKLRCLEETCSQEAFGIYGDGYLKDIKNLDEKNIYEQYKKVIETSPIDIIIIGDEDENLLADCIKSNFGIKREKIIEINKPSIDFQKDKENIVKEAMEVTQGKICMAIRTNVAPTGDDFYKLMLMNELLGGSANSKLFLNIREKESLCYNISSFIYRFKALLFIQSGVDEKNFEKVVSLIKEEIKSLEEGNINEDEFENAKKSIINKFTAVEDYPASTMDFYLTQYMLNDSDRLEDVRKKLRKVEIKEVAEIAKSLHIDTVYFLGKNM